MKEKEKLRPLDRSQDRPIEAGFSTLYNVPVPRIVQRVGRHDVIIFQITQRGAYDQLDHPLRTLIFGNPGDYTGQSFIPEAADEWTRIGQSPTPRFNCHSFSMGERIGLTPSDWVEGEVTDLTNNTNPTALLLSSYFRQIRTYDVSHAHKIKPRRTVA